MYALRVKTHFDAAHKIDDYEGACRNLHGHRWDVEVSFSGCVLDEINMLIDFANVKAVLNELFSKEGRLDHHYLNESLSDKHYTKNVTAEFLAKWIYDQLVAYWNDGEMPIEPMSVTVWESPDCCVEYSCAS